MPTVLFSSLAVGFIVKQEAFAAPFRTMTPERYHLEDRYNPVTGKKLAKKERVVDRPGGLLYVVEGKKHESLPDMLEDLSEITQSSIDVRVDSFNGKPVCIVQSRLTEERRRRFNGTRASLKHIDSLKGDLRRVAGVFKERFGIDLGEPCVHLVETHR